MGRSISGSKPRGGLAFAIFSVALFLLPAVAAAAPPEAIFKTPPPPNLELGSGPGELNNPRAVAADPNNGHFFVAEYENARVSEFTAWGDFVKAFGWDVAPGAVDEEQEVRVRATAGQFKLSFGASTTPDLPFDATAAQVETALDALPTVSAGGGGVSVSGGSGVGLRVYVVRFDAGPLAATDVAQIVAASGATPLSGGVPFSGVSTATRANGTSGGTGLESCTGASGCKAGIEGEGSGQFASPNGLAVDAIGNVYVFDLISLRISKFASDGRFLVTLGGDVNKTKVEEGAPEAQRNLCPVDPGDVCQAGTSGSGPGQFETAANRDFISFSPTSNTIFVGDADRVQEFNLDGSFKSEIPFEGDLAPFAARDVTNLDIDSAGNLYLALSGLPNVHKISPTGDLQEPTFELPPPLVLSPQALAIDPEGTVYVAWDPPKAVDLPEIVGFNPVGSLIPGMEAEDQFGIPAPTDFLNANIIGLGTNLCPGSESPGNLYAAYFLGGSVAYVESYGTPPVGCEPPPPAPPEITAQFATAVDTHGATVKAQINPRFWPDTTYYVQYGTGKCSEGGCITEEPAPPGALLTGKAVAVPVTTAGVFLGGLQPGTTYHYRFVAQSGGGGPVTGPEASFTTFPLAATRPDDCPNAAMRSGPSAGLPDCRAYEMVSPLDKNNGDVVAPRTAVNLSPTEVNQSSNLGEALTYSAGAAFGDSQSTPYVSQYVARRDARGEEWVSTAIAPPRTNLNVESATAPLQGEFKYFSADLCRSWLMTVYDPPLATGAVQGFPNIYRRGNCGAETGTYEALTLTEPPDVTPDFLGLELQGASADGSHAIYTAFDSLAPGAPVEPAACVGGTEQACQRRLYEHVEPSQGEGAQLRFVCIRPNGTPIPQASACYAGTVDFASDYVRHNSLHHAISTDGSRIYWTESAGGQGPGTIYVRIDGQETRDVSKLLPGPAAKARFWEAAADGSAAIFTVEDGASALNDDLYRFDLASGSAQVIAEGVVGVMGASEDAKRVYFASTEAIAGSGENSEGSEAHVGENNLYLWTEGEGTSFIATLADVDLPPVQMPSPVTHKPSERLARVSPDGRHAAFASAASPTGYDNIDANSGNPDAEVFLYRADQAKLLCISCNPSGARPSGQIMRSLSGESTPLWVAAQIPLPGRALYDSRALAADGRRLFLESFDALLPADTNGVKDVYQWELAASAIQCEKLGADLYVQAAEGCLSLISTGTNSRESRFLDADPTGDNVFISTLSSLVPPDYGLVDVYNARVGGGFHYSEPEEPCEGEACQSPPPPPVDPTPGSASYEGPENLAKPKPRRCRKNQRAVKRAGKVRCVKKKQRKRHRRAER